MRLMIPPKPIGYKPGEDWKSHLLSHILINFEVSAFKRFNMWSYLQLVVGIFTEPTSRSTMDPRRIGAKKLLNPKNLSQKLFKIGRLIIIHHCVIGKPMAWGTLILRNTHVLLAPKDFNNHSLLISSPAAICQSCRDTSPTGGK